MAQPSIKDVLQMHAEPKSGRYATESNRFPGHEARMAAHIHRIRNHACERLGQKKCSDCIRRRM